jgi:hypothetical protein
LIQSLTGIILTCRNLQAGSSPAPGAAMKKLMLAVLLVGGLAAGAFIWNSGTAAGFDLTPSFMLTTEERQLRDLADELQAVRQRYAQAGRSAAIGGLDTTADIEAARSRLRDIEKELEDLDLPEGRATAKAMELREAIQQLSRELG